MLSNIEGIFIAGRCHMIPIMLYADSFLYSLFSQMYSFLFKNDLESHTTYIFIHA